MNLAPKFAAVAAAFCLLVPTMPASAADDAYPSEVRTMENMRLASPLKIDLPRNTTRKSQEIRTVVIVAHVGKDGRVLKSRIQEASGAHHVDEAVLLAMRSVRFYPCVVDGEPVEVSVVMPMHLAADDIRRN